MPGADRATALRSDAPQALPTHPLATPTRPARIPEHVSDDDVDQLWRAYAIGRSDRLRTRLILYYMGGHVRRQAERVHAGLPRQVDVEDLVQVGFLGLCEAIDRFDPGRGIRFETFSTPRIRGAMRDYLRSIDPVPRLTRTRVKRLEASRDDFQKRTGREPSDDELRTVLGVSGERFRELAAEARAVATVSYHGSRSELGSDDDEVDALLGTFDARDQPPPHHHAEREDLKRWVTRGLGLRDRLILVLYYYEALTMKEIGRTVGISESRVSQRLDTIRACLRSRLTRVGCELEGNRLR